MKPNCISAYLTAEPQESCFPLQENTEQFPASLAFYLKRGQQLIFQSEQGLSPLPVPPSPLIFLVFSLEDCRDRNKAQWLRKLLLSGFSSWKLAALPLHFRCQCLWEKWSQHGDAVGGLGPFLPRGSCTWGDPALLKGGFVFWKQRGGAIGGLGEMWVKAGMFLRRFVRGLSTNNPKTCQNYCSMAWFLHSLKASSDLGWLEVGRYQEGLKPYGNSWAKPSFRKLWRNICRACSRQGEMKWQGETALIALSQQSSATFCFGHCINMKPKQEQGNQEVAAKNYLPGFTT